MACEWPLDTECLGDAWAAYSPQVQERATHLAVNTLRRLTAYRVGGCPVTVRPVVAQGCCFIPRHEEPSLSPGVNLHGQWVNDCSIRTPYGTRREVPLPAPVGEVYEIKIDGTVVALSDFALHNGRVLVWQGAGDPPWPLSQDVTVPDTEPGTFSVTYLNAYAVDLGGAYAAALLANEYAKACTSDKKCRLPSGVQTLTRQGVTMEIASGAFPNGLTGIREVDAWIALWNPRRATQQTMVYSPDLPRPRVTAPVPPHPMQLLDGGTASVEVDSPLIEGGTP